MKNSRLLYAAIIIVFTLLVTLMTVYMGISVYRNNLRSNAAKIIDVEVTDLGKMISYNDELGKTVEHFYSMKDVLVEYRDRYPLVEELFLTDGNGKLVVGTDTETTLTGEVLELKGAFLAENGYLYTSHQVLDDLYILAKTDLTRVQKYETEVISEFLQFGMIGCSVVIGGLIISIVFFRNSDHYRKCGTIVLILWIVVLGVYVSILNYRSYRNSLNDIVTSIENQYNDDLAVLNERGVDKEYIRDIDEYLGRYISCMDEISSITETDEGLDFTLSTGYMGRVLLGYFLQMLLIFCFSMTMLAEFNIFIKDGLMSGGSSGPELN